MLKVPHSPAAHPFGAGTSSVQQQRQRPCRQRQVAPEPTVCVKPVRSLDSILSSLPAYANESADYSKRCAVLDYVERILTRWSDTLENGSNPWQKPRVALVSFGSFRLGVHRVSSDLDVLAVGPPSCTRDDFFTTLVQLLYEDSAITDVHPIPQAYTPVIKFDVKGYSVDMLFARVTDVRKLLEFSRQRVSPLVSSPQSSSRKILQDYYKIDDVDLMGLDQAGMRSMNGARVSQLLLELVPNLDSFRQVLKAVKEWAVQVGIYSNVLGLLGGINWAILVAWVCKQRPDAAPEALLVHFFHTFAAWEWPNPVILGALRDIPPAGVVPMPAWNPKTNPRDGLHICPIITPAYPSMNSSYNVGLPQLRRVQDEFILASNRLHKYKGDVSCIFRPSQFFERHEHFVQVTISASNRQDYVEWFRLVESRLRLLIVSLETPLVHAWPFAKFFDVPGDDSHESLFYIGLRFDPTVESVELKHLTSDFLFKVNTWEGRRPGMDLKLMHVRRATLPSFVIPRRPLGDENAKPAVVNSADQGKKKKQAKKVGNNSTKSTANKEETVARQPKKKCRINKNSSSVA